MNNKKAKKDKEKSNAKTPVLRSKEERQIEARKVISKLNELELTDDIFKIICAMSTNDYSIDNMNLYKCIDTYKNYLDSNDSERFIDYLLKDGKYIKDVDKFQEIINIYNLREVDIDNDNIELDTLFNKNKENGDDIKDLLEKHNFVFVM